MNIMSRNKRILVYMIILSLLSYWIVNVFTTYDIEQINKIETKIDKKKGKAKELFIEDNIDYYTSPYVVRKNYSVFIIFDSSYLYQQLARPPPC